MNENARKKIHVAHFPWWDIHFLSCKLVWRLKLFSYSVYETSSMQEPVLLTCIMVPDVIRSCNFKFSTCINNIIFIYSFPQILKFGFKWLVQIGSYVQHFPVCNLGLLDQINNHKLFREPSDKHSYTRWLQSAKKFRKVGIWKFFL